MSSQNRLQGLVTHFVWKPEYDQVLDQIARNEGYDIDWNTLRQIIAYKILEIVEQKRYGNLHPNALVVERWQRHEDNEENNSKDLDQLPNEFELNDYKDRIGYSLSMFESPPFTIQRIGELLSEPDLYYRTEVKFLRAIEKVVYVTSTVEDFPTTTKKPSGGIRPRSQGEMEVEFLPFTSPAAAAAGTVGGEATTVLPSSSSPVSGIATSAVFTDATDGMLDSGETVMVPPVALGGAPMLSTSDTGVVHLSPQHDPAKLDLLDPMAEGTGKTALLSQQTTELSPNLSPVRSNPDNSREETHAGDDNEPVSPPSLNGKAIKDPSVAEPGDNVATDVNKNHTNKPNISDINNPSRNSRISSSSSGGGGGGDGSGGGDNAVH